MIEIAMIILGILIIAVGVYAVYLFVTERKKSIDTIKTTVIKDELETNDKDFRATTVKQTGLNPVPVSINATKSDCDDVLHNRGSAINPKPVQNLDSFKLNEHSTVINEIGFAQGPVSKEAVKTLLTAIAQELNKKANNEGKVLVNYLGDDIETLRFENGAFYLRNEELLINGLMQHKSGLYVIAPGDRIVIRFCVNFTLPEGYDIQVSCNKDLLDKKGLLLRNITDARSDATSIRAVLAATESCFLEKEDELFTVRVLKEVVQ